MKKAREEREKREKLKEIRKIQDEKDEKEKQQKKEKEKEIQIKSKNKIKNSQEDDNQERISDRDSDWEIERTLNNRKYKNYSPNGEAVQRAQQGGNDLRFDITRAARKWAKITEGKLRKRHKEEGIDVPYEVIYGGKLEALFKYYQRKLTDKHQQEFRNFRDQLMILTSDLEEENQEPRKKQVERTMTKPKPKPVVETTPRETIISKPGPSYEISNKFDPLANSEESNVETGKKIEVGYETDRIERSAKKRAKKQVQKEAKRKNNEKNTKEVTDNAEIISEGMLTLGKRLRDQLNRELDKKFTAKLNNNSTIFKTNTERDYRKAIEIFERLHIEFHTFTTKEEKIHSFVLKGLDNFPDEEEIKEDLMEQGIEVKKSVSRLATQTYLANMFKLVVLSALVAVAVAKPSGLAVVAPAFTSYTAPALGLVPGAVSHSYRSDVISKPVVTSYAAPAVVAAAPVLEKVWAPVAAPAAVSHSYRSDLLQLQSAKYRSDSSANLLWLPFPSLVASAPILEKVEPVAAVAAPAAVSQSYRSDIISEPVVSVGSEVAASPVVETVVAPIAPAAVSHSYRSDVISKPVVTAYSAPAIYAATPILEEVVKPVAVSASVSHSYRSDIINKPLIATYSSPAVHHVGYAAHLPYIQAW
ncbi:hypothetical protein JTB14_014219 [Gonioctena quinquepunctata]|nr:hypothetical protein JTB14_014219 [Gonioctena quinquepunctata]